MATSIRAATADDIDSLVNLESRLFESDAGVHDPAVDKTWPQRKGRADFENLLSETKSLVLVASDGPDVYGHLVGWVSESSDVRRGQVIGYVRSLFVDEHLRRRHLAHDLLDEFMKRSKREHGAASISVTAYAGNHAARAFYAALGFKTSASS